MRFGERLGEPEFEDEKERDSMHMWLLRLTHNYMAMDYSRFIEMGIHPGQLPVMRTISMNEGITQRELANSIHVKPPTIAVTIKRMEKAGFICRKEDKADRRVCRLYLTEKGKELSQKLKAMMTENEKVLVKGFSEAELVQMKEYFGRIIQNIREGSDVKEGLNCDHAGMLYCKDSGHLQE